MNNGVVTEMISHIFMKQLLGCFCLFLILFHKHIGSVLNYSDSFLKYRQIKETRWNVQAYLPTYISDCFSAFLSSNKVEILSQ